MAGQYKIRLFNKNGTEISQNENSELGINESALYMEKVSTGLVATDTILMFGEDENGELYPLIETMADSVLTKLEEEDKLPDEWYDSSGNVLYKKNFRMSGTGITRSTLNSLTDLLGLINEDYTKFLFYIDNSEQENLRFFEVNQDTNEVIWTDKILFGLNSLDMGIHIGFIGDKEGSYENNIYICEVTTDAGSPEEIKDTDEITYINKITVHSYSIGEDERYRDFFTNFGIPDPITYLDVFKDSDIFLDSSTTESEKEVYYRNHPQYHKYDSKIDYQFLNEKSKELYLSYSDIFPYIGTYKALINAVDYLGYDDIYFKEWFKELSDTKTYKSKNVAYDVTYKNGTTSAISRLPIEKRIALKKLNWLSMVYKISEVAKDENDDIIYEEFPDNVRVPMIQNNYADYESDEILIKLISLKNWLEKNIIGLNCRIIEINGEGIVFQRFKERIYGKTTVGTLYNKELSLTPFIENKISELEISDSMCKLRLGLKEQNTLGKTEFLNTYKKVMFKGYLKTKNGALSNRTLNGIKYGYCDVPILIHNGEIFFDTKNSFSNKEDSSTGNIGGSESVFLNLPIIQLERARLRNLNGEWKSNIEYSIDDEGPSETPYRFIRTSTGLTDSSTILYSKDYIMLRPMFDESGKCISSLKYSTNNDFGIPLFIFKNYCDDSIIKGDDKTKFVGRDYILEILDGKFIFNDDLIDDSSNNYSDHVTKTTYLNFDFDDDSLEQNIEINYVYSKIVDLEDYKNSDRSYLDTMTVQNIGEYTLIAYASDEYNNIFCNQLEQSIEVYMRDPSIYLYSNYSNSNNKSDFYNKNVDGSLIDYYSTPLTEINAGDSSISMFDLYKSNNKCLMKESYMMKDVSVIDSSYGDTTIKYVSYPTMSYAIDTPKEGDIAHFMNITDKFKFVKYCNSTDSSSEYFVKADSSNSYITGQSKYIIIWFDRNNSFNGNTLNSGIMKENEELPTIKNSTFIVYDKIHNEVIYQEPIKLNYAEYGKDSGLYKNYIIIEESIIGGIYLMYKKSEEEYGKVCYDASSKKYVKTTSEKTSEGIGEDLKKFIEKQQVYEFYIMPDYEIPIVNVVHYSINNELVTSETTLRINSSYVPYKTNILKVGDKVKLKYELYLDSLNKILTQSTYTVKNVNSDYITIDGYYSFSRLEEGVDYKIITDEKTKNRIENDTYGFRKNKEYEVLSIEGKLDSDNQVTMSHSNCAYVDYEMDVDYAQEFISGKTELHVKNDIYLYHVDNTYSMITKSFSSSLALSSWMSEHYDDESNSIADIEYYPIYKYSQPISMELNDCYLVITPSTTYENFKTFSENLNERHCLWKILFFDKYKKKNVLKFESWNDSLFINPKESGIYSIELYLFDNYGNLVNREIEGIFKIN